MKALSTQKLGIVAVALLLGLGLGGTAMANDSGENNIDNMNTTGPDPYMPEFNTPAPHGYSAYAKVPVQHRTVSHQIKK